MLYCKVGWVGRGWTLPIQMQLPCHGTFLCVSLGRTFTAQTLRPRALVSGCCKAVPVSPHSVLTALRDAVVLGSRGHTCHCVLPSPDHHIHLPKILYFLYRSWQNSSSTLCTVRGQVLILLYLNKILNRKTKLMLVFRFFSLDFCVWVSVLTI